MYDNSPAWAHKFLFYLSLLIFLGTIALMFVPFRDMTLATAVFTKLYLGIHGIMGGLIGMSMAIPKQPDSIG